MNFRIAAISLAFISGIAAAISYFSGLGYWPVFSIVAGALILNGFIATVEDDLPGGFNNADGTETPPYIGIITWVVRGLILLAVGAIIFIFISGSRV